MYKKIHSYVGVVPTRDLLLGDDLWVHYNYTRPTIIRKEHLKLGD